MPKMTHDDADKPINADPELVDMYQSQGWRLVGKPTANQPDDK